MAFPPTHPALERALTARGYAEPTPVQSAVLESNADERDLLVSAQTGSGKTVAFGLAASSTLLGKLEAFEAPGAPLCLVIAPTRELALQVERELTWLYADAKGRVVSCVGGMDARREARALASGAHIVVGTPGRLRDHLERGALDLSALEVAVLDEADEMLDMGFREDLEEILDAAPAERRTLLFSATIAKDIAALAKRYQRDALRIDTIARDTPHGDIDYRAVPVAPNDIEHAVVNILRFFEASGALVFCATREAVRHLHGALRERGFQVVALSGEMTQKERVDALQALRNGHAKVCVATDVAARGLDLPDLDLVVHANLPINKAGLLHRSGRTGRAGRKGVSVLLVPYTRRRKAEQLLASAGIDARWLSPPSAEQIREKDRERFLQDPMFTETPAEEDVALGAQLLEAHGAEKLAAILAGMSRSRAPAPEELFDGGRGAEAPARERRERPERGDRYEREDYNPLGGDRPERGERPERLGADEVSWFRLSVGRSQNADPKWLVPLICRLGHVTKKDIGQIRIFPRETKFEISQLVQDRFLAAIAAVTDEDLRIEPSSPPDAGERSAPPRAGKPAGRAGGKGGPPRGKPPGRKPNNRA